MPRKKRDLKAAFFDIDDTLYSTTEFVLRARASAVEAMRKNGLRLPAAQIQRELDEVIAEFSSNYDHHFDKLLLRIPDRAYTGVNPAILVAAGVAAYHDAKQQHLRPFEDVLPILKRLKKSDLVLGVITDGLATKQAEKLVRLGVYDLFHPTAIFISDQIGISKPNPKLFQRACDIVGILAQEAIYIGDRPDNDIDPGKEIGMVTVLVRRKGAKYAKTKGRFKPDYELTNLKGLLPILSREFRIPV